MYVKLNRVNKPNSFDTQLGNENYQKNNKAFNINILKSIRLSSHNCSG